jgi:hypothetical protein
MLYHKASLTLPHNHQEDNHKRVVRQIRNTNQNGSKVNAEKFQDVQDNEKSDRSELTIVTCNKQDLRKIFEETGNWFSGYNWIPVGITCRSPNLILSGCII